MNLSYIKQLYIAGAIALAVCAPISKLIAQTNGRDQQWQSVAEYIRRDWINQMSSGPAFPRSYISAWQGLPFMFYWDTYFINRGLLQIGMDSIAKNNTLNLLDAVDRFGYVGNAVVTSWGMNRSQAPYLSSMVRDVYEHNPARDTAFLKRAYRTLKKEYSFWTSDDVEAHSTSVAGLQRFGQHAREEEILEQYKELASRFNMPEGISKEEKVRVTIPYIVEAASGMDFTPRFEHRANDFVAVELNTLLYVYENNFAWMTKELQLTGEPDWNAAAVKRKKIFNAYCWDKKRNLFLDYDFKNGRRTHVASVIAFQPLWAGLATPEQAKRIVKQLGLFETPAGMATVEKCGEIKNYQWGETSVWSPMQLLVVEGLRKYGYDAEADRITKKFLDVVARNFTAPVPSNYSSRSQTIVRTAGRTYEKYKTDGTINDDEYPASEMMGWTAGVFICLLSSMR